MSSFTSSAAPLFIWKEWIGAPDIPHGTNRKKNISRSLAATQGSMRSARCFFHEWAFQPHDFLFSLRAKNSAQATSRTHCESFRKSLSRNNTKKVYETARDSGKETWNSSSCFAYIFSRLFICFARVIARMTSELVRGVSCAYGRSCNVC